MNVNITRLSPDAQIPAYVHESNAVFDVFAAEDVIIEPGETVLVPTGLAFEIPEGYEMQIRPRSGITLKTKLRVQLGTVDCGYTGEVGVIVDNIAERITPFNSIKYEHIDGTTTETAKHVRYCNRYGDYVKQDAVAYKTYIIRKGDRIAQAVIKPIEQAVFTEVDALGDSDRGAGGFGWSGTTFRKEY